MRGAMLRGLVRFVKLGSLVVMLSLGHAHGRFRLRLSRRSLLLLRPSVPHRQPVPRASPCRLCCSPAHPGAEGP